MNGLERSSKCCVYPTRPINHQTRSTCRGAPRGTARTEHALGSAARLAIQLLCTELAAAESAAAQLFERSALATKRVLSSMVEVDVAESMVAEALKIGDEQAAAAAATSHAAEERAGAAEERAGAAEERARVC